MEPQRRFRFPAANTSPSQRVRQESMLVLQNGGISSVILPSVAKLEQCIFKKRITISQERCDMLFLLTETWHRPKMPCSELGKSMLKLASSLDVQDNWVGTSGRNSRKVLTLNLVCHQRIMTKAMSLTKVHAAVLLQVVECSFETKLGMNE